MIDVEKMRQKILDLAIRGKLVPQDPNEEPASVLLERIRAEQEKLYKEGKIKKLPEFSYIYRGSDNRYYEKNGSRTVDISSEIPFAIPHHWIWVRLDQLGIFKKGPFGSSITKEMFVPKETFGRVKVYEQKNAIEKTASFGRYFVTREKADSLAGFSVGPGDIIVSCAGTIGEIYKLPPEAEEGIINQALMRIRLWSTVDEAYFLLYFDAILKKEAEKEGKGTGMKNIPPFSVLKRMLIPFPPQNELKKILCRISNCIRCLDEIKENQGRLCALSSSLKKKVLELVFSSDKSYYPLLQAGRLISGRDLKPSQYGEAGAFPYLTGASNFIHGTVKTDRFTNVPSVISMKNDVLITCKGTIGKIALNPFEKCHIARQIMAFRCGAKILPSYCELLLRSSVGKFQNASSSLIPGFDRAAFNSIKYPHQRIECQRNICSFVEPILSLLENSFE